MTLRTWPADFRPPTPSRRLTVVSDDGTRLAVEVHGEPPHRIPPDATTADRPTVVLAHGWTCSASFWVRVVHRLRTDLRVVVFDQRGHGRSQAVAPGAFTTDALADDLAAVLAATVPEGRRVVVAGHSMGAMALVALAGRHPDVLHEQVAAALLASTGVAELVGRIALLPAAARALDVEVHRPGQRSRLTRQVLADAQALHRMPLPAARTAINRLTLSPSASNAEREYNADMVLACPPLTYAGFANMLADIDLRADLARFDVPTTVLVGTQDRLTPPWHAHGMAAALPRSTGLVEVPGAGHMTPLTAPDAVSDAVRHLIVLTSGLRPGCVP